VLERRLDTRPRRQVDDGLDAIERERVALHITFGEAEPRLAAQPGEVALFDDAGIEPVEIVHAGHLVAGREQRLAYVRSKEAGGAGDEHSAHAEPGPRKNAMVR